MPLFQRSQRARSSVVGAVDDTGQRTICLGAADDREGCCYRTKARARVGCADVDREGGACSTDTSVPCGWRVAGCGLLRRRVCMRGPSRVRSLTESEISDSYFTKIKQVSNCIATVVSIYRTNATNAVQYKPHNLSGLREAECAKLAASSTPIVL